MADFQKRKQEELSAATATEGSPASAAAASTSTPSKEFEFSKPIRESLNSLDNSGSTNAYMNLDGNVTLNEEEEVVTSSSPQSSDAEISPKDSEWTRSGSTTATHTPPLETPPSWALTEQCLMKLDLISQQTSADWLKQILVDRAKKNGLHGKYLEFPLRLINKLDLNVQSDLEEAVIVIDTAIEEFRALEESKKEETKQHGASKKVEAKNIRT